MGGWIATARFSSPGSLPRPGGGGEGGWWVYCFGVYFTSIYGAALRIIFYGVTILSVSGEKSQVYVGSPNTSDANSPGTKSNPTHMYVTPYHPSKSHSAPIPLGTCST